jgi:hypothetical protein
VRLRSPASTGTTRKENYDIVFVILADTPAPALSEVAATAKTSARATQALQKVWVTL